MQKVLVVLTAYNVARYLSMCLTPWIKLKDDHPKQVFITAVSMPFAGFPPAPLDDTRGLLANYFRLGDIDRLTVSDVPATEVEARNAALSAVKGSNFLPDLIFLLDGDEIYRIDLAPLESMFAQVEADRDSAFFKVPLTNIVFSTKLALKEPFLVNRIWKTRVRHWSAEIAWAYANCFGDDNGMDYHDSATGKKLFEDREKTAGIISQENVAVDHYTWLMDDNSKRKIEYHNQRWGFSSYRWDHLGLHFNEEYYSSRGIPIPDVEMLHKIKRGKEL